jgi:flagellar protein FlaI
VRFAGAVSEVFLLKQRHFIKEVKGELLDSYNGTEVYDGFPYKLYEIKETGFDDSQRVLAKYLSQIIDRTLSVGEVAERLKSKRALDFLEEFNSEIVQVIEVNEFLTKLPSNKEFSELSVKLTEILKKYYPKLERPDKLAEHILSTAIGFGKLSPLLEDPFLEEIMVNGFQRNVFVFHKRFGMCKTNIQLDASEVTSIINKIALSVGKKFSENDPLLDARLPDGSRANATYETVTPFGHSLTIRKFTTMPLSIIDLIANNTITAELSAFLWLMVEGMNVEPMNILIIGGASSGKTTLMNALSTFIRYNDRIISIEDTLELDLGSRENWIQMESRPKIRNVEAVTMDDLLKNALRMRPDRLVVGEVRGEEAQTLFVAMDTGHRGILGTMHANTAREMLLRLMSPPMSVPQSMLALLDIAVVMFRMYDRKRGLIRRVKEVAELERMEQKVLLANIYEWDKSTDSIRRTDIPPRSMDKLAEKVGLSKMELKSEMLIRQRILEWMLQNNIRKNTEVERVIQEFYLNPKSILDKVAAAEESLEHTSTSPLSL